MGISKASYAEKINTATVLSEGLKNHLEELAKVDIDQAFIDEMVRLKDLAEEINVKQERLKADLKSCTDELNGELRKMSRMISRARKLVKIQIPEPQWKEFGIEDTK